MKSHELLTACTKVTVAIGLVMPLCTLVSPAQTAGAISSQAQKSTKDSTKDSAAAAAPSAATTGAPADAEEPEQIKPIKNYSHSSTLLSKSNCKISCLNPQAATTESAKVIDVVQKIYKAYSDKDLDYIDKHLTDDCITFYEGDKKVISGRQAALADIKDWMDKESEKQSEPLIEITLEHPYCSVKEDHAVVTFTALKEIGGAHPGKFKSHVNDVFKKDGDSWLLQTHYRSSWKELN